MERRKGMRRLTSLVEQMLAVLQKEAQRAPKHRPRGESAGEAAPQVSRTHAGATRAPIGPQVRYRVGAKHPRDLSPRAEQVFDAIAARSREGATAAQLMQKLKVNRNVIAGAMHELRKVGAVRTEAVTAEERPPRKKAVWGGATRKH